MNVLTYMARQRERIFANHLGETLLDDGEEEYALPCRTAIDILNEIDSSRGFNVSEREYYARAVKVGEAV